MFINSRSYIRTLRSQFQIPKLYAPISRFRERTIQPPISKPATESIPYEIPESQSPEASFSSHCQIEEKPFLVDKNVVFANIQASHPWREWVNLMDNLLKNGFFQAVGSPFARNGELGQKEANLIRTACLNFARDYHQLIRYLSQEDIIVIAAAGCPSVDRKVVNSGKRLRAHVGINEVNVCRSCIFRGDCDRAYAKVRHDKCGRTVDVMRLLLTYGLDLVVNSVGNKACLNKNVKESVKKLLKEIVSKVEEHGPKMTEPTASESNLSSKENAYGLERNQKKMKLGEWSCPKCNFPNLARTIKCVHCGSLSSERLRKIARDEEHLPLKKGDWICLKCNFLNFARNTRCFQCKEKPPKRLLNPGEWECESCNYINFRRNMICLKCDHKRRIALSATDAASQHLGNTAFNHQAHPWFEQEKQTSDKGHKSMEFVQNEDEDRISSDLRDNVPGFLDFPILGGRSEMSRDVQKQELWRKNMASKRIGTMVHTREDIDIFNSSIFRKRSEYFASIGGDDDDDDDDMAEWFGPRKKHNG